MIKASPELLTTANTLRFRTRSCAAVRFWPDDWSSMVYEVDLAAVHATGGILSVHPGLTRFVRVLEGRARDAGL